MEILNSINTKCADIHNTRYFVLISTDYDDIITQKQYDKIINELRSCKMFILHDFNGYIENVVTNIDDIEADQLTPNDKGSPSVTVCDKNNQPTFSFSISNGTHIIVYDKDTPISQF